MYMLLNGFCERKHHCAFTFSADARNINPKWGVGRSDNGWMTSETFYQYIANVFYPHLKENSIKLPVVLFLHGHKSHLSYQLSLLCNELQIEVISLYPNATRILQPVMPMKEAWRQTGREWEEEHPGEVVNKAVFAKILEKAINISTKTETVVNGSDAIDYTKCLGKKEIQNLDTVIGRQINSRMDYETFEAIVSPERIKIFENIHERTGEIRIPDENLHLLYNIWRFFPK
nr:unnamed protein product [Callosobruchus analis]